MDSNQKPSFDLEFLKLMKEFSKAFVQLSNDAVKTCESQVNQIGWTLDFMLEFCSNDEMLVLYKKLCRHLYFIDQASAFAYVNYYRERWDEESFNNE